MVPDGNRSFKFETTLEIGKDIDMYHKFKRLNLKTNSETIGYFSAYHNQAFAEPEMYPPKWIDKLKLKLIDDWNRQGRGDWKYWII